MSRLAVLFACVLAAGCQDTLTLDPVGDAEADAGATTADAATAGSDAAPEPDAMADEGEPDAAPADCDEREADIGTGHHRAGRPCMNCHDGSGGAPRFTVAGTVFDGFDSTTKVAGATIRIVDANGAERKLVTQQNGNFYTTEALAFPIQVAASLCPDLIPMSSVVRRAGGNCNGCHGAGSRIYIPPL